MRRFSMTEEGFMAHSLWSRFSGPSRSLWIIYVLAYLTVGGTLQLAAPYIRVARFAHDWQVVTIYGFYLIPLSVLLRGEPWYRQYAYALCAIAPVDVIGFAIHSSIAYPHNVIDLIVGERNFTLVFVMVASWMPYLGNMLVECLGAQLQRGSGARVGAKAIANTMNSGFVQEGSNIRKAPEERSEVVN